ncbi:MAG: ABC transporter ATP-binding protein [Leptolyngbya sp. PLA3]|nr:MAG: ABC transporter ATP-binding protein [Cyanobacteria bacterium CYA]MCE7969964.1 ABC transporter ATP-binding protein [Leptolyngbya sp. PL-A3]
MANALNCKIERTVGPAFRLCAALSLPEGPLVTVLFGPSGSGKTTLLRCLAGLERPDRGSITMNGDVWFDSRTKAWAPPQSRQLGYVPQEDSLFPHLTVRGNLEYPLRAVGRAERRARAASLLDSFNLIEFADRRPGQISGGQRQRVVLARAIARRPRLLLLDEPLHALDVEVREQVRAELRRSLAALGAPTILVTHDRADVLALGDRIAVLVGGTIRQVGPVAEVFGRPADVDVARVLGVETVVEGEITAVRDGLATVRVAGVDLAAVCEHPGPGPVLVCIREGDMVLHRPAAERGSARNHLPARVAWMRSDGVLVRVGLDCGFPLAAVITRTSADELALDVGVRVTASIKAPAVHLIRR